MNSSQLTTLLNANPVLILTESVTLYAGEVYTFPDDVTIIIQNSNVQFRGTTSANLPESELKGKRTRLIAPLTEIFRNLNVTGSWMIDRAYPQWFGYTPRKNKVKYEFDDGVSQNDYTVPDATKAIQKAITMKGNGEVFLTQGFYVLKTPLLIPIGISLVGEKGQGANENNLFFRGTVLQSWKLNNTDEINDASNQYMLYFNSDTSFNRLYGEGSGFLAGQISEIKNLTLFNCFPDLDDFTGTDEEKAYRLMTETTACVKGIYAADTLSIENVRFEDIRQAVVFANRYIDSKRIVNCAVFTDYNSYFQYLSKDIYAFEMTFLGDDLLFEHNAVDGKYHKGIHLNYCFGGKISCNIINADITIDNSKSLTFSSNHIEGGHQLSIYRSCVNVQDNYFHVGSVPSIKIRGNDIVGIKDRCVVELSNNQLIFRDFGGEFESQYLDEYENIVLTATEYDIALDRNCIVKIRNMYRYWLNHSYAEKIFTYGIKIQKILYNSEGLETTPAPFDEFNNFSYKLSQESLIKTGFSIDKTFTIHTPNQAVSSLKMHNTGVIWLGPDGTYVYYYQIIWDVERHIIATFNNVQLHEIITSGDTPLTFTRGEAGAALISFSTTDDINNNEFIVRLYRRRTADATNSWKYVDVPICSTQILYDNGFSVCGYQWQSITVNLLHNPPYFHDNDFERITYQGDSIMCRKLTRTSLETNKVAFKTGDVLVNTGVATNWAIVTIK